ncbi:MAG: N-6 DNA methylase, partial [Draconibacterium sp.]|nr:N-6 DNA methylase [Draconibacterium sp.]
VFKSFQTKIDNFLDGLRISIVKWHPTITEIKTYVFEELSSCIFWDTSSLKFDSDYLDDKDSSKTTFDFSFSDIDGDKLDWDEEFFSTTRKMYQFTSQLFEFLIAEEFGNSGLYSTPESVVKLIANLLPKRKSLKLYNPAAGFLNLATGLKVFSESSIRIKASEINNSIYEYGKAFSKINNYSFNYSNIDSGKEIVDSEDSYYDVIVSNLPLSNIRKTATNQNRKYNELVLHTISQSIIKLNDKGVAIYIINDEILYSNSSARKEFRKEIVERGILKTIISLPARIIPQSSVKTSLLVLDKRNNNKPVRFIDATSSKYYTIKADKSISLKVEKIMTEFKLENSIEEAVVTEPIADYGKKDEIQDVELSDIRDNKYSLDQGRYFLDNKKYNEDYSILGKIIKPLRTKRIKEGRLKGFYYQISKVNNINIKSGSKDSANKSGRYFKERAILIGRIKDNYYPILEESTSYKLVTNNDIEIFSFDEEKVFASYLIQELKADYVVEQMNKLAKGTVIKRISREDILSVKVKFPSYDEQVRIYEDRISFSKEQNLSVKTDESTVSDKDIFKTLKHEIGNILQGPNGFLDLLPDFFENHNIPLNSPIVNSKPKTVEEMLQMSVNNISKVYGVLENIGGILFSDKKHFTPKQTELKPFIKKCIEYETPNSNVNWFVIVNGDFKNTKNILAKIDNSQFEYLVRNMVINAISHGKTAEPLNFIVNITEDKDSESIVIDFMNDGEPLPANFYIEDFIKFGKKSGDSKGQGLGGYLINSVVKNHKGVLEILPLGNRIEPEKGKVVSVNVHFSISIPKI